MKKIDITTSQEVHRKNGNVVTVQLLRETDDSDIIETYTALADGNKIFECYNEKLSEILYKAYLELLLK